MRLNRRIILLYSTVICSVLFIIYAFASFREASPGVERNLPNVHIENIKVSSEKETCYYDSQCPAPHILFRLHAETADHPPFGCLNDIILFHNNISVGINVISLNGTTGDVLEAHTFDVTTSDGKLMTWLRSLPEYAIVIAVSFGDIAERVSRDARETFHVLGASKVDGWRTGYSYSIIGQRGLKGHAFEQLMSLSSQGDSHMFESCFDLPIGDIGQVNITETVSDAQNINRLDEDRLAQLGQVDARKHFKIKYGKELQNCGIKVPCKKDEIPMSFFSGEHKDDYPRVCVGGRMVFDKGLNKAGRGLNIFSLEPKTAKIRLVANFDTYEDYSTALEDFLDTIPNGDIVAAISFDEASTALSEMAKQIFYELGSSQIHRLKFRASWYFVGQKGIKAYTPFEDLIFPTGNSWAKPIQTSICVPKSLPKWTGRQAEEHSTSKNLPKRHFCAKYDKYDEFCSEASIDKPIAPRPLSDATRSRDMIYNTPIIVASGLSTVGLQKCLDSLMNQEGMNTQMVLVVYDKEYSENAELATLYHAKSLAVNVSYKPNGLTYEAISNAFHLFPSAPAVAVIEEDVIPTPDWLKYFEQTLVTLLEDSSLDIVQAFNDYGCCDPHKWNLESSAALLPEISRVQVDDSLKPALLNELKRTFSNGSVTNLNENFKSLDGFEKELREIFSSSDQIHLKTPIDCSLISAHNSSSLSVLLPTSDLSPVLGCFNIPSTNSRIPTYKGIFRFFHDKTDYLLVAANSTLFKAS